MKTQPKSLREPYLNLVILRFSKVSPDDDDSYTIHVLSAEIIHRHNEPVSESISEEELIERAKQKTTLRLNHTLICVLLFWMVSRQL